MHATAEAAAALRIRYAQLPPAEAAKLKQRLVASLPQRLHAAAQWALTETELIAWRGAFSPRISQLERGQKLTGRELLALWIEADRLERLAIDRLARAYRVQVYQSFRIDRAEYDRRIAGWLAAEAAWRAAGGYPEQQSVLIAWLQSALAAVGAGRSNPPPPRFHAQSATLPAPPPATHREPHQPTHHEATAKIVPDTPTDARTSTPVPIPPIHFPRAIGLPPPRHAPRSNSVEHSAASRVDAVVVAPSAPTARRATPDVAAVASADLPRVPRHVPVAINLDELVTRARAFNLALAALEESLAATTARNADQLPRMVDELGQLVTRHTDLSPYYRLVSEAQRPQLPPLRPCVPAIELAARRLNELRSSAEDAAFHADSLAEALERASRRLAEITAEYHAARSME